jgi:hypothetical protein
MPVPCTSWIRLARGESLTPGREQIWVSTRLSYAQTMVLNLRSISVGSVSLAIAILVRALSPPGGSHLRLTRTMMPARGSLIARADHPDWRRLLIKAAMRRADELSQLRQLPDTSLPSEITEPDKSSVDINEPEKPSAEIVGTAPEIAGVPPNRSDAESEDVTGTVAQSPEAAIPVGIGEASSTELPVVRKEELPPVIRTPEPSRPPHEGLKSTPESTKPAQEKESVKAGLKSATKAASEPAKPARESKKAETMPAKPARERGRRVRHRQYNKGCGETTTAALQSTGSVFCQLQPRPANRKTPLPNSHSVDGPLGAVLR